MTKSVLQEVWLFLFFLSLLHTTLPQCTPFDDPTCSVSECLQCVNVPADCTTDGSTIQCEVDDITRCSNQTCGAGQHVCSIDFIGNGSDWAVFSSCFPFVETSTCSNESECRISIQGIIECCCFEDDCFNGTSGLLGIAVSRGTPDTITTSIVTSVPPSSPSSSSTTVIVVTLVVGLGLLVIIVVVIVVVVMICCRHAIQKHRCYCCSCCWSPKTTKTGISRQFSGRSSQPWVLQGLVGQGKFGHVYKALYHGEIVAVKVYSHHNRTTWENERNLFSLESTRHINIIDFVTSDTNECRGVVNSPLQLYLVTQYYPLGTLQEFLRTHVLSWKQACCVVKDVACGLKHLHSDAYTSGDGICMEKYAIAHRDIKTSNILMKNELGECAVADLGLALKLVPTDDPSEISNHGQAGTLRYMSPEALEARVNLLDLQSFKQIDIYAFSLVMWEVMSRCCVLTSEDVGEYELPFADVVTHPTLEVMKDVVCTRQLRPLIPAMWSNHEPLATFAELVRECWDEDPTARLTAGNIHYQMDDLYNSSPQIQQGHAPTNSQGHPPTNQPHALPDIGPVLFQEHSQSSPPPCYSPTDPIPFSIAQNQENRSGNLFQSSMPHIVAVGNHWEAESATLTPRCTRSLRSSAAYPLQGQNRWSQYHPPLSVRNSLVLGGGRTHGHDDPLPTFSDATLSSSHSTTGIGMGRIGAACSSNLSSVLELNVDSGIQINTPQSSQNSSLSPDAPPSSYAPPTSDATPTSDPQAPAFIESTL